MSLGFFLGLRWKESNQNFMSPEQKTRSLGTISAKKADKIQNMELCEQMAQATIFNG